MNAGFTEIFYDTHLSGSGTNVAPKLKMAQKLGDFCLNAQG